MVVWWLCTYMAKLRMIMSELNLHIAPRDYIRMRLVCVRAAACSVELLTPSRTAMHTARGKQASWQGRGCMGEYLIPRKGRKESVRIMET